MSVATLVPTNLNYFQPPEDGSKPWITAVTNPADGKYKNWEPKSFSTKIENVRGKEGEQD
jgi:hypothetical protein